MNLPSRKYVPIFMLALMAGAFGIAVAFAQTTGTNTATIATGVTPAAFVSGAANTTGTGAVSLIAAPGSGVKLYITGAECGRTDAGTTAVFITFSDSASTIMVMPNNGGGGGSNMVFVTPLVVAANTAFTFTSSSGITTMYCNAQGYKGQ